MGVIAFDSMEFRGVRIGPPVRGSGTVSAIALCRLIPDSINVEVSRRLTVGKPTSRLISQ